MVSDITAPAERGTVLRFTDLLSSGAGAIGALALQRYVIVIATAFSGAQTAVVGGAALLSSRSSLDVSARSVFRIYPLDPLPATRWDLVAFMLLGLAGLFVQLRAGGRKK